MGDAVKKLEIEINLINKLVYEIKINMKIRS